MTPQWKSEKHAAQWTATLATYAAPLRPKSVGAIDTEDVLLVLRPIWAAKPETASRVRGRIEAVLDAAKASGLRSGDNPARWRGHLDQLLPRRQRLSRGHHAALPYPGVPTFMADLRARQGTSALALEFTVLTAARSGETRKATWDEFDLDAALWTVPAVRMKAGREHRVPLSARAVEILRAIDTGDRSGVAFPGKREGAALSETSLDMLLRRMSLEVTTHGFRSSFRDWASETTSFPHEVCEMALAHTIANKAEAAYRRGDLFAKRRELMDAWAAFCDSGRKWP